MKDITTGEKVLALLILIDAALIITVTFFI